MWRKATLAFVTLAIAAALVGVGSADATGCPAAKTCRAYVLDPFRWPMAQGQSLLIPYYVSTAVSPPAGVPVSQLPAVTAAATAIWERADPKVHFKYEGVTTALPGVQDGVNVIGYGPPSEPGVELANASIFYTSAGRVTEADISIDPTHVWTWDPCPQRNGGCAGHTRSYFDYPGINSPGPYGPELQGVLEHELGHWLSLDHPDALGGSQMTMYSAEPIENMSWQTLGLGDILGVRAAYPCGKCGGAPVVYTP